MKYPRLTAVLIVIFACICSCLGTIGRPWLVSTVMGLWADQVYDVMSFGWEEDTPESLIAEAPELGRAEHLETFATKEEFDKYVLDTYGPDQEIYFTCSYYNSSDNFEKMPVSRAIKINCYYGAAFIYKFQIPK